MRPEAAIDTASGELAAGAPDLRVRGRPIPRLLREDGLLVTGWAVFAAALAWRLSGQVNQDAWLALLGGREVVEHGLPHHDTLTVWGQGHAWIDQQWLAQVTLYWLYLVGGIGLVAFSHCVLTAGAYALAIVAARRLGGSSRSVLFLLPVCCWILIGSTWQVRAQSLAYLPFVALVWLLAADNRRPTRRVYLTAPLVVLLANLHGSAVLAAALVCARALACLPERRFRCAALLALLSCGGLLATPYGAAVVGYYRHTLLNPAFGAMLTEWQAPTLGPATAPFFALLAGTAWLVGRCPKRLTLFEQLALVLTGVGGLLAVRNLGWFALVALMLVPSLLDEAFPAGERPASSSAIAAVMPVAGLALLVGLLLSAVARPAGWFEGRYPAAAASVTAGAAAAHPDTRIFADVGFADWLLFEHPELGGRLAYDARYELLPPFRIRQLYDFDASGNPWRGPTRGYRLLVLDARSEARAIRGIGGEPGARVLFRSPDAVVIERR